jgi:cytochrome c551
MNSTVRVFLLFIFLVPLILACSKNSNSQSIKAQQYFVEGERLYAKHCSNCHRPSGKGLGRLYPPLAQSDYMNANFEEVICLMKYGKQGEIIVNGKSYNKAMPGIPSLTELEIAEIATYIYTKWDGSQRLVETQEVGKILEKCNE